MSTRAPGRLYPVIVVAVGVVALTFLGAVMLLISLGLSGLGGTPSPEWSALRYAVTALLIGVAYAIVGILWAPFGRVLVDRDRVTDPLWQRGLRVLAIVVAIAALTTVVEKAFALLGLQL